MGVIAAFLAGYAIGARAGNAELEELVRSFNAIRTSPEFADFATALRSHLGHALRGVAGMLDRDEDGLEPNLSTQDVVDRVRNLVGRR
jgi:hypothetical protein